MNANPETIPAPPYLRVVNEEGVPSEAGGYVKVPVAILKAGLSAGAVYTYCWLQRHDGERGCFPSLAVLSEEMAVGERSIRRYLEELEHAGFVRAQTRRGVGGGGSLPTSYLLFPAGDAPTNRPKSDDETAKLAESRTDEPAKNAGRTGQKRHDEPAKNDVRINVELEPVNKNQGTRTSKAADRPAEQAKLIEPDPAIAVVLEALNLSDAAAVRAVTAIVAAFPAVNHALASACCAEWCAKKRRKTSAAMYRNWCGKEANGASDAKEAAGAARPDAAGRPGRTPDVQGVSGGTAESKASTAEWIRSQRAQLAALVAPAEGGAVPGVPVRRE